VTRVLLDTNVVLDFLLDRAPFADEAAALWQANDDGRIEAYVSAITPVNVFYVARKLKGIETARQLVMEHGAHYQLTVKNNQPTLRQNIDKMVPTLPSGFSPSGSNAHPGTDPREE